MMDFSISVEVGQAWTHAPHDTHSDFRKSVGPAEITEAKPRPSTVSAKVPCTSSHARTARADDALGRIEGEVRVRFVFGRAQVVRTFVAIAHLAQAYDAGHLLQLAVAVCGAGQAVER